MEVPYGRRMLIVKMQCHIAVVTSTMWQYGRVTAVEGPGKTDMVGKALWVLQALGDYPQGAQLAELARRGGFPLSTAHRLAGSLVREGFATFDERTRRYHLGLKLFALAARVSNAHGFAGAALPVLQALAASTREAALMSVLEGRHQLYVHYVKGPQQVNVIGEPGRLGPLHNTSMGKVLVAFAPRELREELVAELPLEASGPNTITAREEFAEEIAEVRRRGYAIADQEHERAGRDLDRLAQLPDVGRGLHRRRSGADRGRPQARPAATGAGRGHRLSRHSGSVAGRFRVTQFSLHPQEAVRPEGTDAGRPRPYPSCMWKS
jgi:IclR family acetate operon transcriptional repressor